MKLIDQLNPSPVMATMKRVVYWCANECKRQHSGEVSVAYMFDAWALARLCERVKTEVDMELILALGRIVEPEKNKNGFRTSPVVFANGNRGAAHGTISSALGNLVEHGDVLNHPGEFYKAFEEIHPFADGNGRVGAILFNWSGLDDPAAPPNYFA